MRLDASSAFVDSASPGRNDADSFRSLSENLPGRLAPETTPSTTIHAASTAHLARGPEAMVSRRDMMAAGNPRAPRAGARGGPAPTGLVRTRASGGSRQQRAQLARLR